MALICKVNGNNQSHSRLNCRSNSAYRARGESPTPLLNVLGSLASSSRVSESINFCVDTSWGRRKREALRRLGNPADRCLRLASYIVFLKASYLSPGFVGGCQVWGASISSDGRQGRAALGKQPVPHVFKVSESQRWFCNCSLDLFSSSRSLRMRMKEMKF